jgi:hypothetical protein
VAQEPARAAAGMGKALEGSGVATESEKERAAVQSAMGALARLAPCGEGQGQPAFAPPRPAASRSQGTADRERHAKPLSQTPATTLGLSPSAPSRSRDRGGQTATGQDTTQAGDRGGEPDQMRLRETEGARVGERTAGGGGQEDLDGQGSTHGRGKTAKSGACTPVSTLGPPPSPSKMRPHEPQGGERDTQSSDDGSDEVGGREEPSRRLQAQVQAQAQVPAQELQEVPRAPKTPLGHGLSAVPPLVENRVGAPTERDASKAGKGSSNAWDNAAWDNVTGGAPNVTRTALNATGNASTPPGAQAVPVAPCEPPLLAHSPKVRPAQQPV